MIRATTGFVLVLMTFGLIACSPKSSGGGDAASMASSGAGVAAPAGRFACSSPEVKATLEELIWENVDTTLASNRAKDQVAGISATVKARIKIRFDEIATSPPAQGERPTCEATVIGSAAQNLNADLGFLQAARRFAGVEAGGNVKVDGKDIVGRVTYVITPADDGKTFRVAAKGIQAYSVALAGLGLGFQRDELQAKFEAQKATAAPLVATAAVEPTAAPPGTSVPEQQESAGADYEAADKALNTAYTAARARLDDAGKTALRDQQRAWIKTRDANCSEAKITADSKGDIAGGSAMALELAGCRTQMTVERTKQLAKG